VADKRFRIHQSSLCSLSLFANGQCHWISIDRSPSLSWNYSSDEDHDQDRSVLYLGTNLQDVTDMSFTCKVQDDGTLHDSYDFEMIANQTYYWRVVAYNGSQATVGDVWTFTTESIISSFPYNQDLKVDICLLKAGSTTSAPA
jgi:hypothetical protein